MGLGGITRDSIADLASLVPNDDDVLPSNNNVASLDRASSDYCSYTSSMVSDGVKGGYFEEEERRCVLNDDGEDLL